MKTLAILLGEHPCKAVIAKYDKSGYVTFDDALKKHALSIAIKIRAKGPTCVSCGNELFCRIA